MNKRNKSLLILCLYMLVHFVHATDATKITDKMGNSIIMDWKKFSNELSSPEYSLSELIKHSMEVTENDWQGRQTVYGAIQRTLIFKDTTKKRREKLIEYLAAGVNDTNAWLDVVKYLSTYNKKDFSKKTMSILRQYYKDTKLSYYNILLYGIIDIHIRDQEIIQFSKEQLDEKDNWLFSNRWVARLVMARQGDKDSIKEVIQKVLDLLGIENLIINENEEPTIIRYRKNHETGINGQIAISICRNCAYIKQPESVDLLWAILNSDEKINHNTLFAQSALVGLTMLIEDFPISISQATFFPHKSIVTGREWMKANAERVKKSLASKNAELESRQ